MATDESSDCRSIGAAEYPPGALEVARGLLKDAVCEHSLILFHTGHLYSRLPARTRELLGNPDMPLAQAKEILETAIAEVRAKCPGFAASVRKEASAFDLELEGETEWSDVLRFVHGTDAGTVLRQLSPAAEELLARTESGEFDEFITELKVRRRVRCFGWNRLESLLAEIRQKRGITIAMEQKDRTWNQRTNLVRFVVTGRRAPDEPPVGLNPEIPAGEGGPLAERAFEAWFLRLLAEVPFEGTDARHVWSIGSRQEFARCFRVTGMQARPEAGFLFELLSPLRSRPEFEVAWNFGNESPFWCVQVRPKESWEATKSRLRAVLAEASTEVKYGIGGEAAALFEWVGRMNAVQLERGLTPELKRAIEAKELRLKSPWPRRNFRLFVTLLCQEISAKTPVRLEPVDWFREPGPFDRDEIFTRLLVRR